MEFGVGSILEGKVTGITKFGAFVSLPEGRSGLVHISEIAYSYVNEVSEHLQEGQEVKVKVINIDQSNRINLSIKKALPQPEQSQRPQRPAGPRPAPRPQQSAPAPRAKSQPPVFAPDQSTLPKGDEVLAVNAEGVCISPNDVPGYDKDQYMPAQLKDENGKAYAYRDAAGNYYELNFGLSY